MRLRLFRAATVAAAMGQVRAELGGEALILSTRRIAGGVELTAGIEPDPSPLPPPLSAALQATRGPARGRERIANAAGGSLSRPLGVEPAGELDRAAMLAWHGVPAGLARRLRAGPLAFALSAVLRFAALPLAPGNPPLLVSGAPGAGKTLTVARLATRLVLAGTTPLVITTDARRAGSAEQLAAFTRLLGLELLAAGQPATLARALGHRRGGAPVLIDTPGIDPFDRGEMAMLAALAEASDATLAMVLPAGLDAAEAGEVAAMHVAGGARLLVTTRLDLARRLGSVLAAADAGLVLAEFGIGPGAADGLVPATPARLAQGIEAARSGPAPLLERRA